MLYTDLLILTFCSITSNLLCVVHVILTVGDVAGLPTRLSLDYSAFEKYVDTHKVLYLY